MNPVGVYDDWHINKHKSQQGICVAFLKYHKAAMKDIYKDRHKAMLDSVRNKWNM